MLRPIHHACTIAGVKVLTSLKYLSQYLTNLMHKICFTISFISCLYMFRAPIGVMIPEAV